MSGQSFHIVLHEPVIPQNTGSIARLCACTGAVLHLIHPLGFLVDEASVKRAGLDYWPHVEVREHSDWTAFCEKERPEFFFFFSKFATRTYSEISFPRGAYLIFGSETKGLPRSLHETFSVRFYKIPMRTHLVRSLNLSQAAAIVLYEALRQNGFPEEG
jgi:tRNA (cytidine/uridine-2'-O-)-methyltransferase